MARKTLEGFTLLKIHSTCPIRTGRFGEDYNWAVLVGLGFFKSKLTKL